MRSKNGFLGVNKFGYSFRTTKSSRLETDRLSKTGQRTGFDFGSSHFLIHLQGSPG